MPIGLREFHRFLELGQNILARKAIVGSFSVAHLTSYHDGNNHLREKEVGLDFFYGSTRNQFWQWYNQYLDIGIDTTSRDSILDSLRMNKIAITDLISSCERKEYSALDSSLSGIIWNSSGIIQLLENGVNTFLCTSKWVMQNLEARILKNTSYQHNHAKSIQLQEDVFPFIAKIPMPKNPLIAVYNTDQRNVYLIALPTPGGGTFRKLDTYGYNYTLNFTSKQFVHLYLEASFKLFKAR